MDKPGDDLEKREWALANARRNGKDKRTCGHVPFKTDCCQCAFEEGRRVGQAEAGAYSTSKEFFDRLRARSARGITEGVRDGND